MGVVQDLDELVNVVVPERLDAVNRFSNRSGYSPQQRAFGTTARLPACLLSDDPVDRLMCASAAGDAVQRAWEIRSAAQKALFEQNSKDAIERAFKGRSRIQIPLLLASIFEKPSMLRARSKVLHACP